MSNSQVNRAVEVYRRALDTFLEADLTLSTEQLVLDVLMARDAVHATLADTTPDISVDLIAVIELDDQLKKQAKFITQEVNLADWRASLDPPEEAWWWSLEAPVHPMDRLDWFWSGLAVIFLSISLSLVVEISSRFLSGGTDTLGTFAVISQSVLTLLAAGGALTKTGREFIERTLKGLRAPTYWWQEIKLGIVLLLCIILVALRLSLPQIAVYYNDNGFKRHISGELSSAEFNYTRALTLNPDYPTAHYNLGLLYEDLQRFDDARTEYEEARQGGLGLAYNNLARLYILSGEYSEAVALLQDGLQGTQASDTRYTMLKNLGWARLEQGRLGEARIHLEEAIQLDSGEAPAHCLLAQVWEAQNDTDAALTEWDSCLKYASSRNPDEDAWIGLARQALKIETTEGNRQ